MNMKKGFTLIEIMIVVAIIAILASIAIPNFIAYRQTSQENACKANMKAINNACEAYVVKHGSATTTLSDLTDTSKGAFLKKTPVCPYDKSKEYTITQDTTTKAFIITCGGHDATAHNVNETTTTTTK